LQPASSLSLGRLLPDAFQPFIVGFSEITILSVCSHREQSFKASSFSDSDRQKTAYSVEKLRMTMIRKFKGIFQSPRARITDRLRRSELHQAEFSCDFCYPLVPTVRIVA